MKSSVRASEFFFVTPVLDTDADKRDISIIFISEFKFLRKDQ